MFHVEHFSTLQRARAGTLAVNSNGGGQECPPHLLLEIKYSKRRMV
jgi:hypothetical protein